VNNTLLVRFLQTLADLHSDPQRFFDSQRPLLDLVGQAHTIDVRHRDEEPAVFLVDAVDTADVGMIETGRGLRFPDQTRLGLGVVQCVRREEFQRDRAAELRVLGLVDDSHPAFAELLGDFVVRDRLAGHLRR